MTQHQEIQSTRQLPKTVRFVGSAQRLANLRHSGFVGGDTKFSGCVLRADDRGGRVRFIACVRATDETGDITGRISALESLVSVVVPSRVSGGWEAALTQAANAADAFAERAAQATTQ